MLFRGYTSHAFTSTRVYLVWTWICVSAYVYVVRFMQTAFFPKTQLSWLARLGHSHCNSAVYCTNKRTNNLFVGLLLCMRAARRGANSAPLVCPGRIGQATSDGRASPKPVTRAAPRPTSNAVLQAGRLVRCTVVGQPATHRANLGCQQLGDTRSWF